MPAIPRLYDPESEPRFDVAALVKLYFETGVAGESQTAVKEKRRVLDLFVADFGNLAPAEIVLHDAETWVKSHPEWASDWTRRRVCASLNRVFNWGVRGGLIDRNPIKGLSNQPGETGRPMDDRHYRAMLRGTSALFRRVLLFIRFSGVRPSEAAVLEWPMVDMDRATATLIRHKTAKSRRDRKPRVIVLHPILLRLLAWIRKRAPLERFVFTNADGRPWCKNSLDLRIYRLRLKLGIPEDQKLYGLRHAYGTRGAKSGLGLATLSELMGHTSERMTMHYIHLAGEVEHLRQAVIRMNGEKR